MIGGGEERASLHMTGLSEAGSDHPWGVDSEETPSAISTDRASHVHVGIGWVNARRLIATGLSDDQLSVGVLLALSTTITSSGPLALFSFRPSCS